MPLYILIAFLLLNVFSIEGGNIPFHPLIEIRSVLYLILGVYPLLYYIRRYNKICKRLKYFKYGYNFIILSCLIGIVRLFFTSNGLYPIEVFQNYTSMLSMGYLFIAFHDKNTLKNTICFSLKYLLPLIIFIFLPFYRIGFLRSVLFFLLPFAFFYKYASFRNKWVIIILFIFIILYPGQRINLLYFLIVTLILIIKKISFFNLLKFNKIIASILCLLPFIGILAYSIYGFNILDFSSYINDTSVKLGDENLFDDTRTFIYEESITSITKHGTWLLGETPAYGYESLWRTNRFQTAPIMYRLSEVAIVNIYVWFGLIGFIGFITLYIYIIRKALLSNNIIISSFGVWIAIYFFICWITNCNAWVTTDAIVIYMIMGLVLRSIYDNWTPKEFELYLKQTLSTKTIIR